MATKHKPPVPPKGNKYAVGNNGGAPEIYTDERIKEEAKELLAWLKLPESIYFKSFAVERGYHPNRLQEFAAKSPEFSCALEIAKAWQEQRLINYGLFNKTNSTMTKFVLTNCHSWKEATQISGDAVNPISLSMASLDGASKDLVVNG